MLRRAIAVRPEQQGGALPARPAPAADRPRRGGASGSSRSRSGCRAPRAVSRVRRRAARGRSPLLAPARRAGSARGRRAWPVTLRRRRRAGRACAMPSSTAALERKRFIIETNGAGVGAPRLRRRRLARRARAERHAPAGRRARGRGWPRRPRRPPTASTATARDGTFADVTDARRPAPHGLGLRRSAPATTTTTAGSTCSSRTSAGTSSTATAGGRFEDVDRARRPRRDGDALGLGLHLRRLRPRRPARPVRRQLPALRPRAGARARQGRRTASWKGIPVNCGPKGLPTDTNLLYPQPGRRHASRTCPSASGVARVTGRYPMTAAAADFDGDGWPDIYVACDSTAAILYRNNRDGTFTDVAVESGVAYSEYGQPAGGHGPGGRRLRPRRPARPR